MISYRQADLLPTYFNQVEIHGHIILIVANDTIDWEGFHVDTNHVLSDEIQKLVSNAFDECGFAFGDDGLPYYALDYSPGGLSKEEVINGIVDFIRNTSGFKKVEVSNLEEPRVAISFNFYPLMNRKADLLPKIMPVIHERGQRVALKDLRPSDAGLAVKYKAFHLDDAINDEVGRISSWNDQYIFVQFIAGGQIKACDPSDVTWL